MENQVRELFRQIAEDIPPQREVPPTLRPRARRRFAATVGVTVVVVGALVVGGVAAVREITESSPRPADVPKKVHLPNAPEAWRRIALPDSVGCRPGNCHVELVAAGDAGLVATSYTEIPPPNSGAGVPPVPSGKEFVGWSSPDGLSWHPIEGEVWQSVVAQTHGFESLAAAGPGFVAGGRGAAWTSTDGVSDRKSTRLNSS